MSGITFEWLFEDNTWTAPPSGTSLEYVEVGKCTARIWPGGLRIDLTCELPPTAILMKILRSGCAFCQYLTDPGEEIYSGDVKTTHEDSGLEENKFYYYSFFFSDDGVSYYTGVGWQVEGLSIKDYTTRFGDYVYALLPKRIRQQDSEDARGDSRYLMKKYCMVIQGGVNVYRGWIESLLKLRDPDEMPAGRLGVASNQTGILAAQVADFGLPPEKAFDAGVLRRIVAGIIPIYRLKGTCPGLVNLIKLFAGWDSRCDEAVEPVCGVNRIFQPWDGESYPIVVTGPTLPVLGTIQHGLGYSRVYPAALPGGVTDLTDYTIASAFDNFSSFACIDSIIELPGPIYQINYTDPTAQFYGELLVTGSCVALVFTVTVITAGMPWQIGLVTGYGYNAFAGMKFTDAAGTIFNIVSSTPTDEFWSFTITLDGNTAELTGSIAQDFVGGLSFANRQPISSIRLIVGSLSMLYTGTYDIRLLQEESWGTYWSPITAMGATLVTIPTFSPSDVIMWVTGVHEDRGLVTSLDGTTAIIGVPESVWTPNQWTGYYLIPNWNCPRVYKILTNTDVKVTVELGTDPPLTALTGPGANFIILSEENAIKYQRLLRMLPSFLPHEARAFIKFEDGLGALPPPPM
jgi:hypothetical protein